MEIFNAFALATVSPDKLGTERSEPVAPLSVKVCGGATADAFSVGVTLLTSRRAASVCVGTLVMVGDGVPVPSKTSTSAVAGTVRVGDQFAATCQSVLTVPVQT